MEALIPQVEKNFQFAPVNINDADKADKNRKQFYDLLREYLLRRLDIYHMKSKRLFGRFSQLGTSKSQL